MKNIRVYPFSQKVYDEKHSKFKTTFYNDVVTQYEILYSLPDMFNNGKVIVGIHFEENDTENDIINTMNLLLGNPDVYAIVVSVQKLDENIMRYAIQSVVDDDPNFTFMREEKYRNRLCYVRIPSVDTLHTVLKDSVWNNAITRLNWNHYNIDVNELDRIYSKDAGIEIICDKANNAVKIIFINQSYPGDAEIKLYINCEKQLEIRDLTSIDEGEVFKIQQYQWMTDFQKLYINDLNKIITYRK